MSPILIIGAGPVGLTMAAELARYGVPVRIVDRSPEPTQTSRALVVWSRTLELMDRMGCTTAFLGAGLKARGATIRSSTRVLGHPTFDRIASPYAFALMIPQSETERLLTEHLATFGVAVERRVELIAFAEGAAGVAASLGHADGREESIDTPFLLGCDGAHSVVRHGLGLAFRGQTQGDDWILADVRLEGAGRPPSDEIATYLHRDGPFVIFPIPGGRARIIAMVGTSDPASPRADPTLAEVQALIDSRTGGGFVALDPVWLSNFRINGRKVADYRRGRVMLLGDAAHVHSPAGGQGMNTGMQDAIGLTWRLALVWRGAADTLLDSYSAERSAVGDKVLRNAGLLTALGALRRPSVQAIRNAALHLLLSLSPVRGRIAAMMSEIDIAYPYSPLSKGRGAGMRLAPEHYDGPPPGAGERPRFILYAPDVKRGAALASQFPLLVEARVRRPPNERELLIVRPDGYVGFSGGGQAWWAAEDYLRRINGRL